MLRTVEAVYENGMLRPLEPIEPRGDQIYLVTILDTAVMPRPAHQPWSSLRGKYRGYLSPANQLARDKAAEQALER